MRTFTTFILFACLTVIGFALLPLLSVQWLPSGQQSQMSVEYSWPGASPKVLEREVTSVLEGAFGLVRGVENLYSISRKGTASITLDLKPGVDIDGLRFEIASKIRQIYPSLPAGVSYPQISTQNAEQDALDRPVLLYSLSGADSPEALFRFASDKLKPRLSLLDGVEEIQVKGGNASAWKITMKEELLMQLGLREADISMALQSAFERQSLGQIFGTLHSGWVVLDNTPEWMEQQTIAEQRRTLLDIPIAKVSGQIIRLGQLARLDWEALPPTQFYRVNGQNSIRLAFYAQSGVNQLQLAPRVKEALSEQASGFPPTYQLIADYDATAYLKLELEKIAQRSLLSLGVLLLLMTLTYRNWRSPLIVFLSLVVNLGIAFIFYYFLSIEIHLYALAGITVSFGMVIDNAIVMMHHWKNQGNRKVFPAILASTLTTLSALLIIWFLPEKWQADLLSFAKVIGINLLVSAAVAVWLIPALMERFYPRPTVSSKAVFSFGTRRNIVRLYAAYAVLLTLLLKHKKLLIGLIVLCFGLPVFLLPNRIPGKDWYNATLGDKWYVENMKPYVNKWLGGTLRLFSLYVYEGSGFRDAGQTVLYIHADLPNGSTLGQMNRVIQRMEAYLSQFPQEIQKYVAQIDNGQHAAIEVYFNRAYEHSFPAQLKSRVTAFSFYMGGVTWNIFGVGRGFSNDRAASPPTFRVSMYGYQKAELEKQARNFADKLLLNSRIQEVNTSANYSRSEKDLYALYVDLDRRKMVPQGLTIPMVQRTLAQAGQNRSPDLYLPGLIPVRLVSDQLPQKDRWHLEHVPQPADSLLVAFSDFARLERRQVPASIRKENQQYIQSITFEYLGSPRFGSKFLNEKIEEMKKELPLGYSIERRRFGWDSHLGEQSALLGLVIVLIFLVCALTFESLRQALAIILIIPTSFIGIFLTFYWFKFPFDQGGYTSFLLTSGLVVNGLIFLINDFNGFRKKYPNSPPLRPYLKALQHKIAPILLTIFSTSLGLGPFLIHGQQEVFWFSLAAGAIGGLLFSVVVLLFFTPLFVLRH
jgi:multidrug efflux pump subunit AcrB